MLRQGHDRVHPIPEPAQPPAGTLPPGLLAEPAVGGQHPRPNGRQQAAVEPRHRQPLVVDDVGTTAVAAVAAHVGEVLGELQRPPAARLRARLGGAPIEALAHPVALRGRHRPMGEAAGDQLNLGTRPRQGGAQRAVIGRRVRRGIDDLNSHPGGFWLMELSYCVVNTNGRELLLTCLEAIGRTHPPRIEHEILVLDNASDDGSAEAVARRFPEVRVIARDRRAGLAENNSLLLREARGRFCLLLNEDSEILEGAAEALLEALNADPEAGAAGAQLLDPNGQPIPCAWRLPGPAPPWRRPCSSTAGWSPRTRAPPPATAAKCARWAGCNRQRCWCGTRPRRRWATWTPTSSSTRRRSTSRSECETPAGASSTCPRRGRSTTSSSPPTARPGARRVVQFHRGRAMYMRKHHSRPVGLLARVLWAWSYVPRAIAAMFMPGHRPGRIGFTPARRFVQAGARACAKQPRHTTPNSRQPDGVRRRPRSSSRAATS